MINNISFIPAKDIVLEDQITTLLLQYPQRLSQRYSVSGVGLATIESLGHSLHPHRSLGTDAERFDMITDSFEETP
jgi:hypothetical protein